MNAVTSAREANRTPLAAVRPIGNRLISALPLVSVYVWLCAVYAVEAWGRVTPWLFGDELDMTQIARSIAETGHPARRGHPYSFHSLYPVVTAPFWLIHDVGTAYAAIKYFDVFAMTAVVFPTYFLARLIVGKWPALLAAAGAGAIPSLAYTGYLVEENLAYPYAALCFFLIAKAAVEWRTGTAWRRYAVAAAAACALGPVVRGELIVLPTCAALTVVFAWWSSDAMRARRAGWSLGDRVGVVVLAFGLVFLVSAILSSLSGGWQIITLYYKHRMIVMLGWAAGTLAIGTGVLPLVGGIAALARLPGEQRSRELRMVRSVMLAGLVVFGLYTAVKAAYLSTVFATRVEERNLIYVAPLLFVGTALLLERRRVNLWLFAPAAALATYLVAYAMYHPTEFPYEMNVQLYSDALGLAILQQANRYLYWTPEVARWVLLGLSLGVTAALVAVHALWRKPRAAQAVAVAVAVAALGWSLTGEIAAATGSNSLSRDAAATLSPNGEPLSWVDRLTGGAPTLYEGVGEQDQNSENLLEFWNRSLVGISTLDGSLQGPGPAGGPNLTTTGKLYWTSDPAQPGRQYAYAVEDWPCVDFAGATVKTHLRRSGGQLQPWRLVRLTRPNRLRAMCTGIYPDHWTGTAPSSYYRFSDGRGWMRVIVSRRDWGGPTPPSPVHIVLTRIVNGHNYQPTTGNVLSRTTISIGSSQTKAVWLRTQQSRFAVSVVVDKTFVPHEYVASSSDTRTLGAQVYYGFSKVRPTATQRTGS